MQNLRPHTHRPRHWLPGMLVLVMLSAASCTGVFFHPAKGFRQNPGLDALAPETVVIPSSGDTLLHGWRLEPEEAPSAYLLFLHGNAENISTHVRSVTWMLRHGVTVLAVDYRGYGISTGDADVDGVHDDASAALAFAADEANDRGLPLFVLGQSLGGVLAIDAVAHYPRKSAVSGLVVDSAFSGYRMIAREKLASFWLTRPFAGAASRLFTDRHRAVDVVPAVSPVPLLIIHGRSDRTVPPVHAERLFAAAREPKELMLTDTSGHTRSFFRRDVREHLVSWMHANADSVALAPIER